MGTDSPKGEGNATQPETVLVSNSFQPTGSLTGNVHLPTDIQGTQAWNGGALEQTKAFSWTWFMIGLLVMPMVLAILSASLVVVPDLLFSENTSTTPLVSEPAFFAGENYTVNEFHMSEKFGKDFATHDFWDLNVESSTWYAFISGYGSEGERDVSQLTMTDDDGSEWWITEFHDIDFMFSVYLQVDGNVVRVASPAAEPEPIYVHYYSEGIGLFSTSSISFWIWPVSVVGGIVWGFAKKRPAFSYGVMVWGSIVLLATVFLTFIALFL